MSEIEIKEQEYIKKRVTPQREYFSKRAAINKKAFYFASILKLIISLSITVVSSVMSRISPYSIIVAILSALVTLTEGILLLTKYKENWITYRITSENLKAEEILYKTRAGEYYMVDDSQAFNSFVQNVEGIIQNSNKNWESIRKNKRGES